MSFHDVPLCHILTIAHDNYSKPMIVLLSIKPLNHRKRYTLFLRIMEDQHQFILHHRVMRQEKDANITVDIIKDTQISFPQLQGCSFDKIFYSAVNFAEAKKLIDKVVMPKKGKLNQLEKSQESQESDSEFVKTRHQHSAVDSAINCLEQHGLDRCPDKGKEGFDCYVALAVLSRNVQRIA